MEIYLKGIYIPMTLIREWGIQKAFFYCYVLNKMPYGKKKKFVLTVVDAEIDTGMNDYLQRRLLYELVDMGYVKITYGTKGVEQEIYETDAPKRCIEILKLPIDIETSLLAV